jgi:hypothetical protein
MRMRRPQDNIDHIRVLFDDRRKRPQHIFDAFVRRKQAKCEQYFFTFHIELVLVETGIDKRRVDNAVVYKSDFILGHGIDFLEEDGCLMAHHDQLVGQLGQPAHDVTIIRGGVLQHRMQRGHHRHAQIPQQFQQVAAGRTAEKSVFMLNADNVRLTDIEKLRRHAVVAQFVLTDLEAYLIGIKVPFGPVVHRRGPDVNVGCPRTGLQPDPS